MRVDDVHGCQGIKLSDLNIFNLHPEENNATTFPSRRHLSETESDDIIWNLTASGEIMDSLGLPCPIEGMTSTVMKLTI
jgi:hypothetical protein